MYAIRSYYDAAVILQRRLLFPGRDLRLRFGLLAALAWCEKVGAAREDRLVGAQQLGQFVTGVAVGAGQRQARQARGPICRRTLKRGSYNFV